MCSSDLENNIPTKIDQGTIWIMKETIPVKKGEPISEKLAGLLTKLDIKAIEAGIVLNSALEDGLVYEQEEMIIDLEKFRNDLAQAYQQAISLSIEAAYITARSEEHTSELQSLVNIVCRLLLEQQKLVKAFFIAPS